MKSIPRSFKRERPTDGIQPRAKPAPHRPAGQYGRDGDQFIPFSDLPPENPHLLRAFPGPSAPIPRGMLRSVDVTAVADRPPCRILSAYRAECERQDREQALLDELTFEMAVAENTLILHPEDTTMAAYLDVLIAARPVLSERTMPSAVIR